MNDEDDDDIIDSDDLDDDDDLDDIDDMDTDNIGDLSVELNIEELTAKLAASDSDDVHRRAEIRRRLEELRELREQELDTTFNFKFDDDD
ncbi:MAG: hypothetical protein KJN77_07420 [Gammaproteobacteria bacterium]|nr:hypothetical protein [Gammaproteobacteria bacterium]